MMAADCPRGAYTVIYDQKMGYILDLCRELQLYPLDKVRNVWVFAMHYLTPEEDSTQQNPVFVGSGVESRNGSKSAEDLRLPDLITDVLDSPRSV